MTINTNALKTYAPKARKDFIAAMITRAAKFGITKKGIAEQPRSCAAGTGLGGAAAALFAAAVESFLSPDHADMQEAAITRRLDRLSRQVARLERDQRITTETLALFVRFWLTITPPIAPEQQAAAQVKGRERFDGFVETLGKRVQNGRWYVEDIPSDLQKNEESP